MDEVWAAGYLENRLIVKTGFNGRLRHPIKNLPEAGRKYFTTRTSFGNSGMNQSEQILAVPRNSP